MMLLAAVLATEEGAAPNPLIPHPAEIIVGLVAFGLLYYFLSKKAFPIFERTFAARSKAIEGEIAQAKQERAEAQRLLAQYQQQLGEARDEAARIRNEAQSQRAEIVEEARVEARTEAQRITEAATAQIASERLSALVELRREVGTLAVDLAGRIVGESLQDDARQRGTVDRYLSELEGSAPAATRV